MGRDSGQVDGRGPGRGPTQDAIRRVAVFSTGTVTIRPEHAYGSRLPAALWLATSRRWTTDLPINVYLIEHEAGVVLFDLGQDRAAVTDAGYFPGGPAGLVFERLARFDVPESAAFERGLDRLGHDPAGIHTAVLSHLHQDHIGGLPQLGRARVLVHGDEWDVAHRPGAELRGYLRRHIDLPGRTRPIERVRFDATDDPALAPFTECADLFGDGSLVLLPTPGHTPGSLSLLVRRPGSVPLLLVGDLTYDCDKLATHVPGVGRRRRSRHTSDDVLALQRHHPGLVVLAAHDPAAAPALVTAWPDATALPAEEPGPALRQ